MITGKPFEVPKEVYDHARDHFIERAKENLETGRLTEADYKERINRKWFYMTTEDEMIYFSESLRWGYGIYSVIVSEKDGKYICTWERGDSCD